MRPCGKRNLQPFYIKKIHKSPLSLSPLALMLGSYFLKWILKNPMISMCPLDKDEHQIVNFKKTL